MTFEKLALDRIDFRDERFRISLAMKREKLERSIRMIGVVQPVTVVARGGTPVLVSGWKRAGVCRAIGLSPLPALILDELDDLRCFQRAIHENWTARDLSLVEKSHIVRKLADFGLDKPAIVREYLPLLGIPAQSAAFEKLLAVSRAAPGIKTMIEVKDMDFAAADLLTDFSPEEQEGLIPWLVPLGRNKQKEFLDDLWDVSRRESRAAGDILGSPEFLRLIASEALSPLQKAEAARVLLRDKKNPRLSSARKSFEAAARALGLPKAVRLEPPASFEDENLRISFDAATPEAFEKTAAALGKISARAEFKDLFKRPV